MEKPKPFWMPDTQGFLAIAIIVVVSFIAFALLGSSIKFDDKVAGAFMTLLGVLTACLKDVYSFFFGSSSGSKSKDDAMVKLATDPQPPAGAAATVSTTTTVEPGKTVTEVQPATAPVIVSTTSPTISPAPAAPAAPAPASGPIQ